jgi:hypothetical protein
MLYTPKLKDVMVQSECHTYKTQEKCCQGTWVNSTACRALYLQVCLPRFSICFGISHDYL